MSAVAIAGVHRARLQSSAGPSSHGPENIAEYRALANRGGRAYLAVVTLRVPSEIPPVHGPPSELEPVAHHVSIHRIGTDRETPRGRCRDEIRAAVVARALAEHRRRAA